MPVTKLSAEAFESYVLGSDQPVVMDFYADWCGPCHRLSPIIEDLSRKWAGRVRFAKVNIDHETRLANAYGVRSIPTVILFEGGKAKARSTGAKPPATLERDLGLDEHADQGQGVKLGRVRRGAIRRWWGRQ